jgi:maleylacetoacetate isomerase
MRRVYTFFRSSTSYRLRIALALKGLEWEPHYVSLPRMEHRAEGYMALNPQGLVPALIEDDGTLFAQSLAIIEYLDEKYPKPPLLPGTPVERAYVLALSQIIGCDIHPLNSVRRSPTRGASSARSGIIRAQSRSPMRRRSCRPSRPHIHRRRATRYRRVG